MNKRRFLLFCVAMFVAALIFLFPEIIWPLGSLSGTFTSDQTTITGKPKCTVIISGPHSIRIVRPSLINSYDKTHTYRIEGKEVIVSLGTWGSELLQERFTIASDSLVTNEGTVLHKKSK